MRMESRSIIKSRACVPRPQGTLTKEYKATVMVRRPRSNRMVQCERTQGLSQCIYPNCNCKI